MATSPTSAVSFSEQTQMSMARSNLSLVGAKCNIPRCDCDCIGVCPQCKLSDDRCTCPIVNINAPQDRAPIPPCKDCTKHKDGESMFRADLGTAPDGRMKPKCVICGTWLDDYMSEGGGEYFAWGVWEDRGKSKAKSG